MVSVTKHCKQSCCSVTSLSRHLQGLFAVCRTEIQMCRFWFSGIWWFVSNRSCNCTALYCAFGTGRRPCDGRLVALKQTQGSRCCHMFPQILSVRRPRWSASGSTLIWRHCTHLRTIIALRY